MKKWRLLPPPGNVLPNIKPASQSVRRCATILSLAIIIALGNIIVVGSPRVEAAARFRSVPTRASWPTFAISNGVAYGHVASARAPDDPFACYMKAYAVKENSTTLGGYGENYCLSNMVQTDFVYVKAQECQGYAPIRQPSSSGVIPFTCTWTDVGEMGPECIYNYPRAGQVTACPKLGDYRITVPTHSLWRVEVSVCSYDYDDDYACGDNTSSQVSF